MLSIRHCTSSYILGKQLSKSYTKQKRLPTRTSLDSVEAQLSGTPHSFQVEFRALEAPMSFQFSPYVSLGPLSCIETARSHYYV